MAVTVPQSRLILRAFMAEMRNNLAASEMVDWEIHSNEMNDRNGFVVSEQVGPEYDITESTNQVNDLTSSGVQDSVFGAQTFTLSKVFGLSFGASDIESIKDMASARRNRALRNGTARLASRIDAHIFDVAGKAFPFHTGDAPGANLTTPKAISRARTRLAEASLESDQGISAAITHADRQELAEYIYNDNASLASEGNRAMRRGFSGMIDNVPLLASNQLGRITTGTRSTSSVDGGGQGVNYSAVADSGTAAGEYLTQTLDLIIGTGGETVKAGEVFTITGVKAWDPEINAARPFDAQFVVLEDAAAVSGDVTVKIFPAIIAHVASPGNNTQRVNNAHATVAAVPSGGAPVVWAGAASTTFTTRAMWKKEAVVVHSAQLILPHTGQGFRRSFADAERDGSVPVMPRVWFSSDFNTGAHKCRIDIFVQAQVRNRWQGVRMYGDS